MKRILFDKRQTVKGAKRCLRKMHERWVERMMRPQPSGDNREWAILGTWCNQTKNYWPGLFHCYADPRIPGTNNALIYTLLANCRAHDLDPEDYLIEVIKRLPAGVTPEQVATPEQAAALTPARIAAERRATSEAVEVA